MYTATGKKSALPAILFTFFIFFSCLFAFLVYYVLVLKNIDLDDTVATYLTLHYNIFNGVSILPHNTKGIAKDNKAVLEVANFLERKAF